MAGAGQAMVHLTLAGLSEDGRRLRLVSDAGAEFTLDVDDRLRTALGGGAARTGPRETSMDSALRPRDIQARIRAGESPEAVAAAAQTSVDRVLVYARPVLAERAHVAERAQRSSVRRRAGEHAPAGARTLGDAVAGRLRGLNVGPDDVEWDAWRREDGRWALQASFASGERSGTASFTFDVPGNYVTLDDEDARWLVGEQAAPAGAPARDDLEAARQRRRAPAADLDGDADELLPLGADALDLVREEGGAPLAEDESGASAGASAGAPVDAGVSAEESTVDLTETAARVRGEAPSTEGTAASGAPADADPDSSGSEVPVEAAGRKPAKRGRRASVPSWDEIMFGGGDRS